jgi:hypothetical protein
LSDTCVLDANLPDHYVWPSILLVSQLRLKNENDRSRSEKDYNVPTAKVLLDQSAALLKGGGQPLNSSIEAIRITPADH